jgi:hypothetical protein
MEAGNRAGHVCTHQQIEQEDGQVSLAGSERPADPPPRVGKHRQPDEFMLRQCMVAMDEKLDALLQTVAILGPLLDEEGEKDYENHLLGWSNYCEELKERAQEVSSIIRAGNVSQVKKIEMVDGNKTVTQLANPSDQVVRGARSSSCATLLCQPRTPA